MYRFTHFVMWSHQYQQEQIHDDLNAYKYMYTQRSSVVATAAGVCVCITVAVGWPVAVVRRRERLRSRSLSRSRSRARTRTRSRRQTVSVIRTDAACGVKPGNVTPEEEARLKQREEWKNKIEEVRTDYTWNTHTPASEQELYAEMFLMTTLYKKDLFHRADDAWQAELMPLGGLVRRKSDECTVFVVRNYSVACLCWPAKMSLWNIWTHDESASSLMWLEVLDINDFEEIPLDTVCPMHMFVLDRNSTFAHRKYSLLITSGNRELKDSIIECNRE